MSGNNKRKSYGYDRGENDDACPKCGCRHYERASAWKNGEKVVVVRICRNCGAKV